MSYWRSSSKKTCKKQISKNTIKLLLNNSEWKTTLWKTKPLKIPFLFCNFVIRFCNGPLKPEEVMCSKLTNFKGYTILLRSFIVNYTIKQRTVEFEKKEIPMFGRPFLKKKKGGNEKTSTECHSAELMGCQTQPLLHQSLKACHGVS